MVELTEKLHQKELHLERLLKLEVLSNFLELPEALNWLKLRSPSWVSFKLPNGDFPL
jgi:hypothetical protein